MLSEPLITLMVVIGFDLVLVDGREIKKPVLSKDGAWVPRGTTFVAAAFVCGSLSMTLGNGRFPTALSCRFAYLDSCLRGNGRGLVSAQQLWGDFSG